MHIRAQLNKSMRFMRIPQTGIASRLCLCSCFLVLLASCVTAPPQNASNICDIFQDKSSWYKAAEKSHQRWGVPIPVQMTIMYQESSFIGNARPPRKKYLGFIPGKRPSNARGYTQALKSTWKQYKKDAGGKFASRKSFADSTDFVGWYVNQNHKIAGIAKTDAYGNYLAYHEGQGGYKRGSYRSKPWLMNTAARVRARSNRYATQLRGCEAELQSSWWQFWR